MDWIKVAVDGVDPTPAAQHIQNYFSQLPPEEQSRLIGAVTSIYDPTTNRFALPEGTMGTLQEAQQAGTLQRLWNANRYSTALDQVRRRIPGFDQLAERHGDVLGQLGQLDMERDAPVLKDMYTNWFMGQGGEQLGQPRQQGFTSSPWARTAGPMGLGLGSLLYGLGSGSPMASLLGLMGTLYGGYNAYQSYKKLTNPALHQQAFATNPADPAAQRQARQQLQQARSDMAPFWKLKNMVSRPAAPKATPQVPKPAGTPQVPQTVRPSTPKLGSFNKLASKYDLLRQHFDLSQMKADVLNDRNLSFQTQARLVTAINDAANELNTDSMSRVDEFAAAAMPALSFGGALALGSLASKTPFLKGTLKQIGGGLVSGAQELGLLPEF